MIIKQIKLGTPVDIMAEIQEINEDIFDGELDTPILEIEHDNELDGCMYIFEGMYYIGVSIDQDYDLAMRTIMHEMVHQWQHQRGMVNMQHDTTFNRKCKEIEAYYNLPPKSVQGTNNINLKIAA